MQLASIDSQDYGRMAELVEHFNPYELDVSITDRDRLRELLKFRRECILRIGEMKGQEVMADQMNAEAQELMLRAEEAQALNGGAILGATRRAKAAYLNEQARFARARAEQAALELRFYFESIYKPVPEKEG